MARYTDPDVLRDNLRQAYDPRQYAHYYQLQCYALGAKYDQGSVAMFPPIGELPDWPDIFPQFYRVGESRRTMSHETLALMKICYMEPDPSFPDLDETAQAVRKAYLLERWRGDRYSGEGHWAHEVHRTFMDGHGLGIGFTQVGIKNGRTHIQHHPLLNCIWDRHYWSAGRSRFIGFIHHLPIETAKGMFGNSIKDEASNYATSQYEPSPMRRVKVIEAFDMGIGKKANPTHAYYLNSLGGPVLDISENEYECLPFAHMQLFPALPGMRRPIGRMDMQMATQEMRNSLERYLKLILMRGGGVDFADSNGLNTDDLQRWLDGETLPVIRVTAGDKPVSHYVHRASPQEPPMGLFKALEMVDREQNTEGGSSDADRANLSVQQRTLGQDQLKQQGADIATAWGSKALAEYMKCLTSKVVWIGSKFDTAETLLDVDGVNMMFNDPANPQSALSEWLAEPSRVVINEDELQYIDPQVAMQRKTAPWLPFLADPYTNPVKLRLKLFKLMGEKDPEDMVQIPQPTMDPNAQQVPA